MILILEDDPDCRINFERFIDQHDYPFISFCSDKEVRSELLELPKIDIAIVDIAGCDGYSVTPLLKDRFPNIIIIIMSGYSDMGDRSLHPEVNYFLEKPFSVRNQLLPILQQHLPR